MNENNLIWENKGIFLGIIYFLLKKNKIKKVCVEDKLFRKLIKKLFPNLKVRSEFIDDDKRVLNISVRNNIIKNNYLVINNLSNIDIIKTKIKNLIILPWYNVYNPIIMFVHKDKYKEKNKSKIMKNAKKFHKIRIKSMIKGKINLSYYKCDYIFWDIFIEHKILKQYCEIHKENLDYISTYLYKKLNGYNCFKCYPVIQYFPIIEEKEKIIKIKEFDNCKDTIDYPNIKKEIKQNTYTSQHQNKFLNKFNNLVTKKIGIMNNILFDNVI